MQRVSILRGRVEDGRTGERYAAGETATLTDQQVSFLNRGDTPRVETLEHVDPENTDDGTGDVTFDAAAFVDRDYEDVVAAIESGGADGHLEAVREADREVRDGREHVAEALDKRAAELATE